MQVEIKARDTASSNIILPLSKSICNRLQIIKALSGSTHDVPLAQGSDAQVLHQALRTDTLVCNVNDAGTAFRFLTAYFASQPQIPSRVLTGSPRLRERPIAPLVDALIAIGADISYADKPNFAPLLIRGKKLRGGTVMVDASHSSQFISALCLIAPYCTEGITIKWQSKAVSDSYIHMTLRLMADNGIAYTFGNNTITIPYQAYTTQSFHVEADWSAATFFMCMLAMCNIGTKFSFAGLSANTTQGDAALLNYLKDFGVSHEWVDANLVVTKMSTAESVQKQYDFEVMPDAAIPFIVLCALQNKQATISGLSTLQHKESARVDALAQELQKLGFELNYENDVLRFSVNNSSMLQSVEFSSHNDHRIAMALSLCAIEVDIVKIDDADCVAKSFPDYWQRLSEIGWQCETNSTND
ncbi:MAG: hypothetical protein RL660_303 [Bacteroidota bacterium]|jgi:3-phosphoshikimate 1-carboxyvinyltransferase